MSGNKTRQSHPKRNAGGARRTRVLLVVSVSAPLVVLFLANPALGAALSAAATLVALIVSWADTS